MIDWPWLLPYGLFVLKHGLTEKRWLLSLARISRGSEKALRSRLSSFTMFSRILLVSCTVTTDLRLTTFGVDDMVYTRSCNTTRWKGEMMIVEQGAGRRRYAVLLSAGPWRHAIFRRIEHRGRFCAFRPRRLERRTEQTEEVLVACRPMIQAHLRLAIVRLPASQLIAAQCSTKQVGPPGMAKSCGFDPSNRILSSFIFLMFLFRRRRHRSRHHRHKQETTHFSPAPASRRYQHTPANLEKSKSGCSPGHEIPS